MNRHGIRRNRQIEPRWKKEVLENRGKRDETPSSITGILARPAVLTGAAIRPSKATTFTGAALKPKVLV